MAALLEKARAAQADGRLDDYRLYCDQIELLSADTTGVGIKVNGEGRALDESRTRLEPPQNQGDGDGREDGAKEQEVCRSEHCAK